MYFSPMLDNQQRARDPFAITGVLVKRHSHCAQYSCSVNVSLISRTY